MKSNMFANEMGYKDATHENKEGHPSFDRSLEEQFVQCLLTNTVENIFYASAKDMVKETIDIHTKMLASDPEFFAKAVIYARNEGYMRLQPTIALVNLSTHKDKKLFYDAFPKVIRTPNDLKTFVEYCKESGIRQGLGRSCKDAAGRWMQNISEYHAIKYGADGGQYSLYNILRLIRYKPKTPRQEQIWAYLVGKEWNPAELQQINAFESLKKEEDKAKALKLVETGKLPYEVVTGITKPDLKMWEYLMRQMPYFALLRHLATLDKHGALNSQANVDYVVERLTDKDAIAKSMILPFRFYSAWHMFNGAQLIKDALITALEVSFINMPELTGKVCIANDVSGSMSSQISDRSTIQYCNIAGIFGAALLKKCKDVIVVPADASIATDIKVSRHDSIMTTAGRLGVARGGTDLGAAMKHLHDNDIKVDTYIGITDNVEWMTSTGGWGGRSKGFYPEWKSYKAQISPQLKTYLITISPYRDYVAPETEPSIKFVYGWNDSVINYIATDLEGMGAQIEKIKAMELEV